MPIWLMQDGDRLTSPPPKQGVVGVNTTVDILFANSFVKMASGLLIPTLAAAPGTTPKVWPYSLASSIAGVLGGVNVISGGTNRGAGNALGIKFAEPGGVSYSAFSAGDAIEYKPVVGQLLTMDWMYGAYQGVYKAGTDYKVGQSVSYLSVDYICIQNGTSETPSSQASYWTAVTTAPGQALVGSSVGLCLNSDGTPSANIDQTTYGALWASDPTYAALEVVAWLDANEFSPVVLPSGATAPSGYTARDGIATGMGVFRVLSAALQS